MIARCLLSRFRSRVAFYQSALKSRLPKKKKKKTAGVFIAPPPPLHKESQSWLSGGNSVKQKLEHSAAIRRTCSDE